MLIKPTSRPLHNTNSINRVMWTVVIASLLPIFTLWWFWGWGIIIVLVLAILVALLFEVIALKCRRLPFSFYALDGSVIITALTLSICLPPNSPWWLVVMGVFVAVVFGKHLYGGLGYNLFNPAMLGYIFLLVSFPLYMSTWQSPLSVLGPAGIEIDFWHSMKVIFLGADSLSLTSDAISSATPLDSNRNALISLRSNNGGNITLLQSLRVIHPPYLYLSLSFGLAGVFMLYQRIIRWHVPVVYLLSLVLFSSFFHWIDPTQYAHPWFQLLNGGVMFAAFFIMTDPVTVSATPKGRMLFAVGAAVLTLSIRYWGSYPDGVAFSVLLMNMMLPLVDDWTSDRVHD